MKPLELKDLIKARFTVSYYLVGIYGIFKSINRARLNTISHLTNFKIELIGQTDSQPGEYFSPSKNSRWAIKLKLLIAKL